MLTVGTLSRADLDARLQGDGLVLRTGPFANRIRSDINYVRDGIALMYADYPVEPAGGFVDFYMDLYRARGLRRWVRPLVEVNQDGLTPFLPLPLDQAYPMLEWIMNWAVSHRAHSYVMIHAAVLEKHGRAVILPAPSGSGKSTLCAALLGHGWRLLSDELMLLRPEDGMLVPVPRPVSLKNASIGVIRAFRSDAVLSRLVDDTLKGTIAHVKAPRASVERAAEPARPGAIVFPRYQAGAATSLTPIPRARAFMQLADNSFNYHLLGPRSFHAIGELIEAAPAYTFEYSSLPEAMALFERLALGSL
jgi:HprK-related kinase A